MYESKVLPFNNRYGKDIPFDEHKRKVIFHNHSCEHITITAVDPFLGTSIEVTVRKDQLPEFLQAVDVPPDK